MALLDWLLVKSQPIACQLVFQLSKFHFHLKILDMLYEKICIFYINILEPGSVT